ILQLLIPPRLKFSWLLCNDAEPHMRVLLATIFRALSAIDAGMISFEPGFVVLPWNSVGLAAQRRHPEGMDDVDARDDYGHRLPGWDVDFIRRGKTSRGFAGQVMYLPPPLVTSHLDAERRSSSGHNNCTEHCE